MCRVSTSCVPVSTGTCCVCQRIHQCLLAHTCRSRVVCCLILVVHVYASIIVLPRALAMHAYRLFAAVPSIRPSGPQLPLFVPHECMLYGTSKATALRADGAQVWYTPLGIIPSASSHCTTHSGSDHSHCHACLMPTVSLSTQAHRYCCRTPILHSVAPARSGMAPMVMLEWGRTPKALCIPIVCARACVSLVCCAVGTRTRHTHTNAARSTRTSASAATPAGQHSPSDPQQPPRPACGPWWLLY
jgi:hypothetical protein